MHASHFQLVIPNTQKESHGRELHKFSPFSLETEVHGKQTF